MKRPVIDPDSPPLEILPWGRTLEDDTRLARKKAKGRAGAMGCLYQMAAMTFVLILLAINLRFTNPH